MPHQSAPVEEQQPIPDTDLSATTTSAGHRIKVAFILDNFGIGGTELNAVRTAERLNREQFEVVLINLSEDGPLRSRWAAAGVPIHTFPLRSLYHPATYAQVVRIATFLRRERIEIVHCHDCYSDYIGALSSILHRAPIFIASKRWGNIQLRQRVPSLVGFQLADIVLANSDGVATSLADGDGVRRERITVVRNFVDDEAFDAPSVPQVAAWRADLELEAASEVVGVVASLRPVKDHATLLRAAAQLCERRPALRIVLVGEGPSRPALAALARELGIESRVRFAGQHPPVPSFHHLFDVSVLCSRSEGFPNSLVEAMAAGRPVIATDVIGNRDAVVHGETGLLVPFGDHPALAAAIDSLLADREIRERMGTAGRRIARERHHAPVVIGSLEALYRSRVDSARR